MLNGLAERLKRAVSMKDAIIRPPFQDVAMIKGMTIAEPCLLFDHYDADKHPRRAFAQLKVNGIRAIATPNRIVTRNALPFNAALHCRPILDAIERVYGCPMVFDGEYAEVDGFEATLKAHKTGKGAGVFHVFDAVPYQEWVKNRFTQRLKDRLPLLQSAVEEIDHPMVHFLHFEEVQKEEVMPMAEQMWKNHYEGIVVKDAESLYQRGRCGVWYKVKNRITHDAVIIDVIMDRDGLRAKSLLLRSSAGTTVRVGSQIPQSLRLLIGQNPEAYSGRTVEFGATDTNDMGRLTGTYFIRFRDDK